MERNRGESAESGVLTDAARSLFRLGRAFGRMPRRDLLQTQGEQGAELSAILIVQAIGADEESSPGLTIGEVAARLGVDPSTASRLVAQAVAAGYLRRDEVPGDRRATALALTAAGEALADDAARYQRAVFEAATAGWPDEERQVFARRFVRFAEAIIAALYEERHA